MPMPDKKMDDKGFLAILAAKPKKPMMGPKDDGEEMEEGGEGDGEEEKSPAHEIASEMMECFHSKDTKGLADCLEALLASAHHKMMSDGGDTDEPWEPTMNKGYV